MRRASTGPITDFHRLASSVSRLSYPSSLLPTTSLSSSAIWVTLSSKQTCSPSLVTCSSLSTSCSSVGFLRSSMSALLWLPPVMSGCYHVSNQACLPRRSTDFKVFIGLVCIPTTASPWVRYTLLTGVAGIPYSHSILVGMTSRNAKNVGTRAVTAAVYNICYQIGSIIAVNIYREGDKPYCMYIFPNGNSCTD